MGFRRLQPQFCSIYDPYFWWHERLWKVPADLYLHLQRHPVQERGLAPAGGQVGKRVFDDGCHLPSGP